MQKNKNNGFSMVEIIISVAIFSILIIPIISGIISSLKNTTNAKTLQLRNEFAENVMEYVKTDSLDNILSGEYLGSAGSYVSDASSKAATVSATFYTANGIKYDSSLNDIYDQLHAEGSNIYIKETAYDNGQSYGTPSYKRFPYEEYLVSGKVKVGPEHDTYAYKLLLTNEAYAKAEQDSADALGNTSYINPNNSSFGVVEDIDYQKIALINGTIANYDSSVSNAFLSRKIEALKAVNPDWYDIYTNQTSDPDLFPGDTVTRRIVIYVSGSYQGGYHVKCKLIYHDNCESRADVRNYLKTNGADTIEYEPFQYDYPAKTALPNIYLMYNVCVYNNMYSPHDYIIVDISGVTDYQETVNLQGDVLAVNRPINVFIVETAAQIDTALLDANSDLTDVSTDEKKKKNSNNVLYKKSTKKAGNTDLVMYNNSVSTGLADRKDVQIHILTTRKSAQHNWLKNLHIYHNFDINNAITGANTKNSKILYNAATSGVLPAEIIAPNTYPTPMDSSTPDTNDAYVAINGSVKRADNTYVDGASVESLSDAKDENRGLYQVKIWMQKGDNPDDIDIRSTQPILTATKGDDE